MLTVEDHVMFTGVPGTNPAGIIVYADDPSYMTGSPAKNAIQMQFAYATGGAAAQANGGAALNYVYYGQGLSANLATAACNGTNQVQVDYPAAEQLSWAINTWYRVTVVADQIGHTFNLRIVDLTNNGVFYTNTNLPYNDATAGYIRKVWFGLMSVVPIEYLDNLAVFQDTSPFPVTAPAIYLSGTGTTAAVNANPSLGTMKFYSPSGNNLTAIQYSINGGTSWSGFTTNGATAVNSGNDELHERRHDQHRRLELAAAGLECRDAARDERQRDLPEPLELHHREGHGRSRRGDRRRPAFRPWPPWPRYRGRSSTPVRASRPTRRSTRCSAPIPASTGTGSGMAGGRDHGGDDSRPRRGRRPGSMDGQHHSIGSQSPPVAHQSHADHYHLGHAGQYCERLTLHVPGPEQRADHHHRHRDDEHFRDLGRFPGGGTQRGLRSQQRHPELGALQHRFRPGSPACAGRNAYALPAR